MMERGDKLDFSDRTTFKIKLTKSLIINLIEKCLRSYVFKGKNINSHISCSSSEQKFDLNNLKFEEFKNEVFNDTKIDILEMSISYKDGKSSYTVILLKDSSIKDEFVIALYSNKKAWIDDNLVVIKNFLDNYKDEICAPLPSTKPNSKNTIEEKSVPNNMSIKIEDNNNKSKENHWDRNEKIAIISIIITVVLTIIGWVITKN
ncbi:hypothetical protein [Clostridium tyrobutyricum]|uniref:hypothetical protein n=1 Tax=Clostridium tyrobutyricum TaxID=1519 RepID=UPI002013BE25|nr:hypothetical protein [Clostridium tyrobutyricum]